MIDSVQFSLQSLARPNFAPEDFFKSDKVYRINHDPDKNNDFNNYPSRELEQTIFPCLSNTADMMQEVRDLLEVPIVISSAYRCKKLNDMVGSNDRSQHMQGLACDWVASEFGTPEQIVKFLHSKNFLADQCFVENTYFLADQCFVEDTWIHMSRTLQPSQNRMMYGYYLLDKRTKKRKFKPL